MKNVLKRCVRWLQNQYIDWHNERLRNKRRHWTAYGLQGGVVPLGKCSADAAVTKVSQFGVVRYVDTGIAAVFYSDK